MTSQFHLISGLLDDPSRLWEIKDKVAPEYLSGAEQDIYKALVENPKADVFELEEKSGKEVMKWVQSELIDIHYHADKVVEAYVERKFQEINSKLSEEGDPSERLEKAQKELHELAGVMTGEREKNLSDVISEADSNLRSLKEQGGLVGINTGYPTINSYLHGWVDTRLYVVAARPGMGKTAFALNTIFQSQCRTLMFSLEMGAEEMAKRMILMSAKMSEDDYQSGKVNWEAHRSVVEELKEESLSIVDDVSDLSDIEAITRRQAMEGLDMVVIDYLQLIHHNEGYNRDERVGIITRKLKMLSKELRIPIILLAQLNRSVETRGGSKKPVLSDLRESGNIEQDADVVAFCYRPEYYGLDQEDPSLEGQFGFLVRKNRHGSVGDLWFDCRMEHYRIYEPDKQVASLPVGNGDEAPF